MSGNPDMRRIRNGSTYTGSDATVVPTQASHQVSEQNTNPYAEASQPSTFAKRPVQIDHSQSVEANTVARVNADPEATRAKPVAANIPQQKTEPALEPEEVSPLPADVCSEQTGSVAIPRVMKVGEVATFLRVSVRQIWRQLKSDPEFPRPFRIGGAVRWDRLVIERYVVRSQARSHPER